MIPRRLQPVVEERLNHLPAVVLLGPRQAGKTTLAHAVAAGRNSIYLDLEFPVDREKLSDAIFYLQGHDDKLVVLDEVQRLPDLFATLRGLIDEGRRPLPLSEDLEAISLRNLAEMLAALDPR
jgi:predicted AAA+ superfamily ATPase